MLSEVPSGENSDEKENSNSNSEISFTGEQLWYGDVAEDFYEPTDVSETKKIIAVGDTLPYGIRMYQGANNVFRLKDVGVKNRILLVGVIGSFTPLCWNHHFLEVLTKFRYFEERGIAYICCIATNDSFTQGAWGTFLGCYESVLMIGDSRKTFTKTIGMDTVVPWLDGNIRSRRYVIYAEDMVVTKIIYAPKDDIVMKLNCDHISFQSESTETTTTDTDSSLSW